MTTTFPYWISRTDPVTGHEDTFEIEVIATVTRGYVDDIEALVNGELIELTTAENDEARDMAARRAAGMVV